MSLAAFALRSCTVRALRGATLAGTAVYDSPVDMSDIAEKATTPSIFVFSDSESLTGLATRDVQRGEDVLDLALMIVLPAVFQATLGGATVEFQDRKAGAAAAIDLIYRQVERALLDEASVWSGLWGRFVFKMLGVEAQAYTLAVGPAEKQRKLPARAIRISVQPISDPPFGRAPEGLWAEFVAAMAASRSLAPLGSLVAAAIQGDALPGWRVDALEIGDTAADAVTVGYAPLGGDGASALAEVEVRRPVPGGVDAVLVVVPADEGSDAP